MYVYIMYNGGHHIHRDFEMSAYGSGPEENEIRSKAEAKNLSITFHSAIDHAVLTNYKVSTNIESSSSTHLCTASP